MYYGSETRINPTDKLLLEDKTLEQQIIYLQIADRR